MGAAEWAAEVRRRRAEARERLRSEAERIAEAFARAGAHRVILFGSVACGTASPTSDIDLVVITPAVAGRPFPGRGAEVLLDVKPTASVDLLVYTPEEWEQVRRRPFVRREVCEKGMILYERGTGSRSGAEMVGASGAGP
ncbi:MAG: nucleotidyltransferase domain-containing protein [Actinomycetia bacterium]|nr:nucleotidyltransferase domain-containing protein [Actinomycetes bacterium]